MFSDKFHVNLLTSALHAYGIRHIVVCAGARNGILAHNFNESKLFKLHSAVDERSAAFTALGIILATGTPACICVTSGSALLATIPAAAEAKLRNLPLLIISADRPAEWIGQLDGQTLPQQHALEPYAKCFNVPEPHTAGQRTHCKRLIDEALLTLHTRPAQPSHINIPIEEPLFHLKEEHLPCCAPLSIIQPRAAQPLPKALIESIHHAQLPVLVIGQHEGTSLPIENIEANDSLLVLPELLANCKGAWRTDLLEQTLPEMDFTPDLIIHIGGNSVNKRLRTHLRALNECRTLRIAEEETLVDTFSSLFATVKAHPADALAQLSRELRPNPLVHEWKEKLLSLREQKRKEVAASTAAFNGLQLFQALAEKIEGDDHVLHLANSTIVRTACHVFDGGEKMIHCNRGTNGIEGSVSVAAGYALASPKKSLLLCGDLSFLYDQNGLWNKELSGNLRILVINNGGGGIFREMPALNGIPERDTLISGAHPWHVRGVAETYRLHYFAARNTEEFETAFDEWWNAETNRPTLMEVFL